VRRDPSSGLKLCKRKRSASAFAVAVNPAPPTRGCLAAFTCTASPRIATDFDAASESYITQIITHAITRQSSRTRHRIAPRARESTAAASSNPQTPNAIPSIHPIHPSIHTRDTDVAARARSNPSTRTKIRPSMRASRRVDTYRGHRRRESHHRGATWISASHSAARSTGPTKNDDDVTNARAQTAHTGVDLNAVRSRVVRGKIVYGRARACARVLKRGRGHRWGREGRFGFFGSDIRRVRVVPRRLHSASSFDDVIGRTRRVTIDRSIAVERVGFTDVEPFFFLFFHARCLRAVRAFGG